MNPHRPRPKRGRPQDPQRNAALASGAIRYMSRKPCRHGHKGERYVSTGACVACYSADRADEFSDIFN